MRNLKLKKRNLLALSFFIVCILLVTAYFIKINYDHKKELYKIVQDFKKEHKDFEVKNYAYGSNDSIIKVALIYYDKEKQTKSNVAIITEKGVGMLDLVSGNKDYSYDNNENWAKAEAIVFSIDYGFPINFSEDFKNNKYDDILKRKLIDVDMIKSLNLNDDDIDNYKYKNNILPDIVFMHMFNEKLEEYDLRISYMINSEVILETKSHKHFR